MEMNEEQKPVAWMLEYKMDGEAEVEFNTINEFSCGRTGGVPLYTHHAPDVVAQLVEALESLLNDVGRANSMLGAVKARAALAAAKEAGL